MADVHTADQTPAAPGAVGARPRERRPGVVDVLLDNMRNDPVPLFRDKAACALAYDQIHLAPAQKLRLFEGLIGALDDPKPQVRADRDPGARRSSPGRPRASAGRRRARRASAAVEAWRALARRVPRKPVSAARGRSPPRSSPRRRVTAVVPRGRRARARAARCSRATASTTTSHRPRHLRHLAGSAPQPGRPRTRAAHGRLPLERLPLGRAARTSPATATSRSCRATSRCRARGGSTSTSRSSPRIPRQELNIALAGPRFFQMEKDGIAFWLGTRDGGLVHSPTASRRSCSCRGVRLVRGGRAPTTSPRDATTSTIRAEGQDAPLVALRDAAERGRASRARRSTSSRSSARRTTTARTSSTTSTTS